MRLDRLDHLVLTVADLDATIAFYTRVLGMRHVSFEGRHALHFGDQKINLHAAGREFEPKARRPTPGSADFCLVSLGPPDLVALALERSGAEIVEGPVARTGALGSMRSVYLRDPDGNLVEIAVYDEAGMIHEGNAQP